MTQDRAPDEGLPPLPEPYVPAGYPFIRDNNAGPALFTEAMLRSYAQAAIQAERERAERAEQDQKRMDWLEKQVVEVRAHLMWGSRQLFIASHFDEEDPDTTSDLRAKVDRAKASAKE
jgi:hypothetical protein